MKNGEGQGGGKKLGNLTHNIRYSHTSNRKFEKRWQLDSAICTKSASYNDQYSDNVESRACEIVLALG